MCPRRPALTGPRGARALPVQWTASLARAVFLALGGHAFFPECVREREGSDSGNEGGGLMCALVCVCPRAPRASGRYSLRRLPSPE